MNRQTANKYRKLIEQAAVSLPDNDAYFAPELFPRWRAGVHFEVDVRVCYKNRLYRCVQAHISQDDWTPDITPALFTEVSKPGEIPVWRQPTGAQDAYMKGDKVSHNGKHWISDVDGNVWEPGTIGTEALWLEIT